MSRTPEQHEAAFNGMRAAEIADALDCSREHVMQLIRTGALPAVDISAGSRPEYRVDRRVFAEFLKTRRVA